MPRQAFGAPIMAIGLAVIVFISGCSSNTDSAAPDRTEDGASNPESVTVPVTAVSVAVLQSGAEPRDIAEYHLPVGAAQNVVLTTTSQVTQQIDEQPAQDFSTPQIVMPLGAKVTTDGQIDLTLGGVTAADPNLSAALVPEQGSAAGLTRSSSGAVSALRIQPASGAQDIARSAVEQSLNQAVYRSLAFPASPIGVGAVWTITQQIMSGISLTQVTTATLTARAGDRLTIDVSVNQTPNSPVWELPDEAGELNIDSYSMTGKGVVMLDLGTPLPTSGEVDVGGDQSYSDPSSPTVLRQSINSRVRWSAS